MDLDVYSIVKSSGVAGLHRFADEFILNVVNEASGFTSIRDLQRSIVELYGPQEFIDNPQKRKVLFDYLNDEQVCYVAEALNLKGDLNAQRGKLAGVKLNKNKKDVLYHLFKITPKDNNDEDVITRSAIVEVKPKYALFSHQERAAERIKQIIQQPGEKVLLHMPTGAGKTRTAMNVCVDTLRSGGNSNERVVVWLADTEELCDQAADEFEKAWGFLGVGVVKLYRFYGSDNHLSLNDIDSGFVVAGLQKLNSSAGSNQAQFYNFAQKASLVVFDEAHKMIAPTYRVMVNAFNLRGGASILGLSATPGRSIDNQEANQELADEFNRQKILLEVDGYDNPVNYLIDQGYLARVNYHEIDNSASEITLSESQLRALRNDDKDFPEDFLKSLGLDAKRNLKIFEAVTQLVEEKKQIIVFAPSVASAEILYVLARYKNINAGLVTGNTDSSIRKKTIDDYRDCKTQVLFNFGVLTTGFDAPKTNAAIIARPTKSLTLFSQMVGRATRGVEANGNAEADIFVVKDAVPGFRSMADSFVHWDNDWI